MTYALLATSAIAPSMLLVWYFHARDAFPEPPRVLWTTFFLGIVSVAPVLLFAWPVNLFVEEIDAALPYGFFAAFLGAAIPEEFFKLLVVWGYSMRQVEFDEPMDGIVYGATASLGFATLENVIYVSTDGGSAAIVRAFTAVPGHAFLGVIMGAYAGRARFAEGAERRALLLKAFAVPALLHGAYDFPLLAAATLEQPDSLAALPVLLLLLLVPVGLCIELVWALRLVRRGRQAQLAGGPPPPAATPPVAAVAAAPVAPIEPAVDRGARPAAGRGKALAYVLTVLGGVLATVGALMILGVSLAMMIDGGEAEELGSAPCSASGRTGERSGGEDPRRLATRHCDLTGKPLPLYNSGNGAARRSRPDLFSGHPIQNGHDGGSNPHRALDHARSKPCATVRLTLPPLPPPSKPPSKPPTPGSGTSPRRACAPPAPPTCRPPRPACAKPPPSSRKPPGG